MSQKSLLLITFFTFFFSQILSFGDQNSSTAPLHSEPAHRNELLSSALAKQQTLSQLLDSLLGTKTPQIIFLSEIHAFGAGAFGYKRLLKEISKSSNRKINCITWEYPSQWQSRFDDIMSGNYTYQQLYDEAGETDPPLHDEIFSYAQESGSSVYAVDWDSSELIEALKVAFEAISRGDPSKFNLVPEKPSIEERNHIMAKKISSLISTDLCKNIVHISGSGHYATNDTKQALQYLISEEGISEVTIDLQPIKPLFLSEFVPTILYWPNDKIDPIPVGATPFGILNPPNDSIMYPNASIKNTSIFRWSSFTATLFF